MRDRTFLASVFYGWTIYGWKLAAALADGLTRLTRSPAGALYRRYAYVGVNPAGLPELTFYYPPRSAPAADEWTGEVNSHGLLPLSGEMR